MVADDTNIFISNTTTSTKINADGTKQVRQKRGMKKQQSLLGMLQCLFLRDESEKGPHVPVGRIVQLHCPSQLLSRANWATICDRIRRWSVISSHGCGIPFGGETLWNLFAAIPLKLIIY